MICQGFVNSIYLRQYNLILKFIFMLKKQKILIIFLGIFIVTSGVLAITVPQVKKLEIVKNYIHKISLSWKKVDDADYYQVKVMNNNNGNIETVKIVNSADNDKTIKNLNSSTTYYFKVRAVKDGARGKYSDRKKATTKNEPLAPTTPDANIIFLHHSTGDNIWNGGVAAWFDNYNASNSTNYQISEQAFPKDSPYGWNNYPYDYWNIWVNHAGTSEYQDEPTLEILSQSYGVIIFKHCFPVSYIEEDAGADITSDYKSQENYKLQYNALKIKMQSFPDTKFIVWTGAALIQNETDSAHAQRAQDFFNWVKNTWDEDNDNIYVFDFYSLETEGSLYMKSANSAGDSHPNETFSAKVAPLFSQRTINVINGLGDTTSLTGE